MSHRHQPAALSQTLLDLFATTAGEAASFSEYAVNAWEKPYPRQAGPAIRRYYRSYRPFICVTLASAFFNLLVPRLGATFSLGGNGGLSLVLSMLAGALIGQVAWFSTWAVFGPGPYRLRWGSSLLAMEALYFGLVSTLGTVEPHAGVADFSIIAVLPLALTSMQAPLWAWKFASGYRLCAADDETESPPQPRQYRLLDILGVTATICVAAAPASWWLQSSAKTGGTAPSLLAICLSASLIGAIAGSIFAWMASATRRRMIVGSRLIYAVVATEFAAICCMGPVAPVNYRHLGSCLGYLSQVIAQSSFNSRFAMFWFLPCAAFVLVLHAGLFAVWGCGYRFNRRNLRPSSRACVRSPPATAAGRRKTLPHSSSRQ